MASFSYMGNLFFAALAVVLLPSQAFFRSGYPDYQNKVVCEGSNLNIRCANASFGIVIISASYGRTKKGNVVCSYKGSETDLDYNCGENDVTGTLRHICGKKRKKCDVKVGRKVFAQPCRPGWTKAYLTVIYTCVKRKRRKKPKKTIPPKTTILPSTSTIRTTVGKTTSTRNVSKSVNETLRNGTHMGPINSVTPSNTHASTRHPTSPWVPDDNVVLQQKSRGKSGMFLSVVMWFIFIKENFSAFLKVFLISMVAATVFFSLIFGFFAVRSHLHSQRKQKQTKLNGGPPPVKTSTLNSMRKHSKETSECERLTLSFPPPPPALAPMPDDVMYPSPQSTISHTRTPPPPKRGYSTDDVGRMGRDSPKYRNVPLQRSISLRTKDNYSKELKFDRLPEVDAYRDIQAVIIQRNNGSTMYMNPMYENGVIVKEAKM